MNGARRNNGRFARRLIHRPPMALSKNSAQRLGDRRVVLLARDLLLRRAIQTDQTIWRDPAFFCIKFCKLDGFGNRVVVNDDGRISERLLGRQIEFDHEHEREYGATSILHVENELERPYGHFACDAFRVEN